MRRKLVRGSKRYLIFQMNIIAIAGMILRSLFDWMICKFITNATFIYTDENYIWGPLLFGIFMGTIIWLIDKKVE